MRMYLFAVTSTCLLALAACQGQPQPTHQSQTQVLQPTGTLPVYVAIKYQPPPCVGNMDAPCQLPPAGDKARDQLAVAAIVQFKKAGFANVEAIALNKAPPAVTYVRLVLDMVEPLVRAGSGPFGIIGEYPETTGVNPPKIVCRIKGSVSKWNKGIWANGKDFNIPRTDGVDACLQDFFAAVTTAAKEL